jgi:hypothetical protein
MGIAMVLDTITQHYDHGIIERPREWGKGYKAKNLTIGENAGNHGQKTWEDEDEHCG